MALSSIFSDATVVPSRQSSPKVETRKVQVKDLEKYVALCAVEKIVKTMKETVRSSVDDDMIDHFIKFSRPDKKCPPNFRGIDGESTASCELRKRSATSGLNSEEIALLSKYGIQTEEAVATLETFIINPKYASDHDVLNKVSRALASVPDLPEDFILAQEGSKKTIVSKEAVDQVFTLSSRVIRKVLGVVFTPFIKPGESPESQKCLEIVSELYRSTSEEEEN